MTPETDQPVPQQSDTDLWQSLQAGQVDALATLYDRYAVLVYAIALKALNNPQDAEDLTHDIFLKLAHSSYNPKRGSLKTFLAVLTRSRAIDRQRRQARSQNSLQTWKADLTSGAADTDNPFSQDERTLAVKQAIAQLSNEQQQVLNLAYREGLSQSAIAEQLKTPLGTVKARTRRALIKLRLALHSTISKEES